MLFKDYLAIISAIDLIALGLCNCDGPIAVQYNEHFALKKSLNHQNNHENYTMITLEVITFQRVLKITITEKNRGFLNVQYSLHTRMSWK